MRVKMHKFVETKGLTTTDTKLVKEKVRGVILKQLQEFQKK